MIRSLAIVGFISLGSAVAEAQTPGPPANVSESATVARSITPTNGAPFALGPTRLLFVGPSCNLNAILADDTAPVLFTGISGLVDLRVKDVESTSTTCTGIVGLW